MRSQLFLLVLGTFALGVPSIAVAEPTPYYERDHRRSHEGAWQAGGHVVDLVPPWQLNLGRDGYASASVEWGSGRFRMLRVESHGRPSYVDSVRVHFANGRSRIIQVHQWLWARNPNVVIDLPGEARALRGIEIWGREGGRGRGWTGLGIVGLR